MSLLPSATFAGPSQAEALWAVAGSTGPGGGVTQLVAGPNITLNPPTGEGVVTISASGGGSGGVASVTASGAGITATPTTGAVVVANTGVTSIVAGSGITASSPTGAVTLTAVTPANLLKNVTGLTLSSDPTSPTIINTDSVLLMQVPISSNPAYGNLLYVGYFRNPAWAAGGFVAGLRSIMVITYDNNAYGSTQPLPPLLTVSAAPANQYEANLYQIVIRASAPTGFSTIAVSMFSMPQQVQND